MYCSVAFSKEATLGRYALPFYLMALSVSIRRPLFRNRKSLCVHCARVVSGDGQADREHEPFSAAVLTRFDSQVDDGLFQQWGVDRASRIRD